MIWAFTAVTTSAQKVAATVDGEPIYVSEVYREVRRLVAGREVHPDAQGLFLAKVLDQLIDRRLITNYLDRTKQGVTHHDVAAAVAQFKASLAARGKTLAEHLAAEKTTEAAWRRDLAWQMSWKAYLDRQFTDEALEAYFNKHRRHFDGTKIDVSHILFSADTDLEAIQTIRSDILAGRITFSAAAQEHSRGPSKQNAGRLGPISRHGVMPESFSQAAFALEPGQISPPVKTSSGIHLIRCNAVESGRREWTEVREKLEIAIAKHIFHDLALSERDKTTVVYTDAIRR